MKPRITRRFEFAAGHWLTNMRPGHKCANQHGHNYVLEVTVEKTGELENGMVIDADDLDVCIRPVMQRLDHKILNQIEDQSPAAEVLKAQPTAENLALYLWWALGFLSAGGRMNLIRVRVFENPRLWAEVER